MNLLETIQERYISDFQTNISLIDFFINLSVVVLLSYILKLYFVRFASTIAGKERFSNLFTPLALSTMLVIMIVKSSIALSLGLVGALSIVRFRTAIKEPEELTFLFLSIAIGLAGGANQPILAVVSIFTILIFLVILNIFNKKKSSFDDSKMNLHIASSSLNVLKINELVSPFTDEFILIRTDVNKDINTSFFTLKVKSINEVDQIISALQKVDKDVQVSFVEQPNIQI
ncbi:MAG: DUF4956 domain-containing protein [Saprospiraceae bacterium]|nr:DUF4956 domain-containing protein [Saprospiraceae bacterium]